MKKEYDIAIVGGGLVGASLACCLSKSGYRIVVLEKTPINSDLQSSYDERGLALSLASCRILDAIGIWHDISKNCVPIKNIHVSDRGNTGIVRLDAEEMGLQAMGYVVVARALGKGLMDKLQSYPEIDYLTPAEVVNFSQTREKMTLNVDYGGSVREISCQLLVGADGSNSRIRNQAGLSAYVKEYNQTAIVSNMSVDTDTKFTAYERFTPSGPLAMLPLDKSRFVSIFCISNTNAGSYMEMDDEAYISKLQEVAGTRIGNIQKLGIRKSYPLKMIKSEPQFSNRLVLLGNSAHTIHPNGAQGFNLGLRDAASLAEILITNRKTSKSDAGSDQVLEEYINFRQPDHNRVVGMSDGLTEIFYTDNMIKKVLRNSAMSLLNMVPAFKYKFARIAMGVDGRQPSLVRGLLLDQL